MYVLFWCINYHSRTDTYDNKKQQRFKKKIWDEEYKILLVYMCWCLSFIFCLALFFDEVGKCEPFGRVALWLISQGLGVLWSHSGKRLYFSLHQTIRYGMAACVINYWGVQTASVTLLSAWSQNLKSIPNSMLWNPSISYFDLQTFNPIFLQHYARTLKKHIHRLK